MLMLLLQFTLLHGCGWDHYHDHRRLGLLEFGFPSAELPSATFFHARFVQRSGSPFPTLCRRIIHSCRRVCPIDPVSHSCTASIQCSARFSRSGNDKQQVEHAYCSCPVRERSASGPRKSLVLLGLATGQLKGP
ncbi:hypothetical protein C8R46DRAFT_467412 [Mycena filopes]|nr:hypothetical protein C8R46DRAFT_467412 [Mycena filopes]